MKKTTKAAVKKTTTKKAAAKTTTTKAVVKRATAKKVSTTTTLHPVIENLLKRNPLNKASKFNAKHDWLEFTSWNTLRGVDHSIYTCNEADIKRRAMEGALLPLTSRGGESLEVIYYNMKTGERFMPKLVISDVKLSPVPSRITVAARNGLSSDGMDDRPW
jgi:hypothetical protein